MLTKEKQGTEEVPPVSSFLYTTTTGRFGAGVPRTREAPGVGALLVTTFFRLRGVIWVSRGELWRDLVASCEDGKMTLATLIYM